MAGQQVTIRTAGQLLAWGRELVDPALRAAVAGLPEASRHAAGYHFGWWDADGRPTDESMGKAFRPTLVLLAAEAVGGSPDRALPAAVAVELVHNFSLLHDDLMDRDPTRRHRPTVWYRFGAGSAILTGDALLALAFDVLTAEVSFAGRAAGAAGTSTASSAGPSVARLAAAVRELIDGQEADLAFENRNDVALSECLSMSERKTGALLGCCCALGAVYGGADPGRVEHLDAFGRQLGLAFQAVDDLLGIWGDPERTGKPAHSDLRNRKKSLPVVAALTSGTASGAELGELYAADSELSEADLIRAADLVERAGGRDRGLQIADQRLDLALRELRAVEPAAQPAGELTSLAYLATDRSR